MFKPPFCPYQACANHVTAPTKHWWSRAGFHMTRCFGRVPRFRCSACGRTFSAQTFSLDFYAKVRVNYEKLEIRSASAMSVRALGRDFGRSPGSILNRLDRLARQSIACHARLRPKATREEDISIDGFVGFDRSQYFPNNITISITAKSRYVLLATHATLRRSGRMREDQKKRAELLYRGVIFERGAIERSFTELLDELARHRQPRAGETLVIITDEKIEYARALARHPLAEKREGTGRVEHLAVNSRLPRTYWNPLFPSNYLDREIRKDQAAHHRESTCFCRNPSNGMARLASYTCWHNYSKRFRIKAKVIETATHAETAGIDPEFIGETRAWMFSERAFLSRETIEAPELRVWKKTIPTPSKSEPSYLPMYAVA